MGKLFFLGAALVLLDVFPGGCSCASTTGGPCQTTCDCVGAAAPIKCPGLWECNAKKVCEYSCKPPCLEDGGCEVSGERCTGTLCSANPTACK
ncbi:MAG: hypothetical protein ACOZQL_00465 [Myxococcota bacterium]